MLLKVISAGLTDVDQAALRAAKALGISTGGTTSRGLAAEAGSDSDLFLLYGIEGHERPKHLPRLPESVRDADGTLILTSDPQSPGSLRTLEACKKSRKPFFVVSARDRQVTSRTVIDWIDDHDIEILNVAGNRESWPGLGERAELFLTEVFRRGR